MVDNAHAETITILRTHLQLGNALDSLRWAEQFDVPIKATERLDEIAQVVSELPAHSWLTVTVPESHPLLNTLVLLCARDRNNLTFYIPAAAIVRATANSDDASMDLEVAYSFYNVWTHEDQTGSASLNIAFAEGVHLGAVDTARAVQATGLDLKETAAS